MSKKAIGEKIRRYRRAANMSQMALAEKLGISYQQLQKYEKGINNISVNRLQEISDVLNIPITKFLEDDMPGKISEEISAYGLTNEEKTLLRLFRLIDDKDIRNGLLIELKGIAKILRRKK